MSAIIELKGHTLMEVERLHDAVRYRCTKCKGVALCKGGVPLDHPTVARIPECKEQAS